MARLNRLASQSRSSFTGRQAALNRTIAKRDQEESERIQRRKIAQGIQSAAITIMNELAQVGPAWSGEFSASWGFAPAGVTPATPGTKGRVYRYNKNNLRVYDVERYMKMNITKFEITNTATYASYATDQEVGSFNRDYAENPVPVGRFLVLGEERDNPSYRHQVGEPFSGSFSESGATATAEEDWYYIYVEGGGLQRDLDKGFSIGFKTSFI